MQSVCAVISSTFSAAQVVKDPKVWPVGLSELVYCKACRWFTAPWSKHAK